MSKPVLYLFNGKVGSFGNAVFGFMPAEVYSVTLDTVSHGSINAIPMSGTRGTIIELSNTPDTGYELDYFTVNGVAIVGNSFTMPAENVTVGAVFVEESPTFDEVTIGTQTWMSKNLAIDDGEGGISTQTFNYGQGDVVEHYYTWGAARRVAASVSGWHLPSKDEWNALISYVGANNGTMLMSTYGWSGATGTDDYGFAAFPAGFGKPGWTAKNQVRFWSSTSFGAAGYYFMIFSGQPIKTDYLGAGSYPYPVRLIKDS